MGSEVFHTLKKVAVGGGPVHRHRRRGRIRPEPVQHPRCPGLHHEVDRAAGFKPGEEIYLALDCAATEYYRDGKYHMAGEAR
jgi:enolase